jgi:hypothetical protein
MQNRVGRWNRLPFQDTLETSLFALRLFPTAEGPEKANGPTALSQLCIAWGWLNYCYFFLARGWALS